MESLARRLPRFVPALALLIGQVPTSQAPSTRPEGVSIIAGGMLVDPASAAAPEILDVRIEGERITAIGPHLAAPSGAAILDAQGRYLVPGLWDMHAHLAAFEEPGHAPERYVGYGVLGVRDMGGHADVLFALRREIAERRRTGPTLFMAGPTLNGEASADFHRAVTSAEEARTAVRELKAAGVDFIKIHRQTSRAAFDAIADETSRLGLAFSGHVPLVMDWTEASNAGMHTIEHVQTMLENEPVQAANPVDAAFGSLARVMGPRGDEILATLARNGTYFTPTLVGYEETWKDSAPEVRALKQKLYAGMKPLVEHASRAGVRILAGTDVLHDQGDRLLSELERLVDAGLAPRAALAAATTTAFAANGRGPGRIAAGGEASLLIVDADPLVDVRNLRRLSTVVLRGVMLDEAKLARLRALKD